MCCLWTLQRRRSRLASTIVRFTPSSRTPGEENLAVRVRQLEEELDALKRDLTYILRQLESRTQADG